LTYTPEFVGDLVLKLDFPHDCVEGIILDVLGYLGSIDCSDTLDCLGKNFKGGIGIC